MASELYRRQAVDFRRQSWLGTMTLPTPISHSLWTLAAIGIAGIVAAWLLIGHYTRREHVTGSLVPLAGLIDVNARTSGVVRQLYVSEGAMVRAGDVLLVLSGDQTSEAVGETNAAVSTQLQAQKDRLRVDAANAARVGDQQAAELRRQQSLLKLQLQQLSEQLAIANRQVASYTSMLNKIRPLVAKGYVSAFQVQDQEAQALQAEAQVKALLRQQYEVSQQLVSSVAQLEQLPLVTAAKVNEVERQLAQSEQQLAHNEAERAVVLRASQDGTISSLLIKPGQAVSSGQTMLTILPANSELQAELLVPSSAIGFVRPGTRVALHYQAFPYQKFGIQPGMVAQISRNALSSHELTALFGQQPSTQPLYRVQVALNAQKVIAYGKPEALKPGMIVDADLLLDRRRMIEWIFEPLYGIRRRSEDK